MIELELFVQYIDMLMVEMKISEYDPGAYCVLRYGVIDGIGYIEYLTFCFAWNEV